MDNKPKRLLRSNNNRVMAGVAGGIGEYFNIDPTWVRIAFIALSFTSFPALIIYFLLWAFVPQNTEDNFPFEKRKNDEFDF